MYSIVSFFSILTDLLFESGPVIPPCSLCCTLPPLLKGYLRLGACVGNGAFIDKQFNTIDICIVLKIESLKERYLNLHKSKKKSKIIFLKKFLKKKE